MNQFRESEESLSPNLDDGVVFRVPREAPKRADVLNLDEVAALQLEADDVDVDVRVVESGAIAKGETDALVFTQGRLQVHLKNEQITNFVHEARGGLRSKGEAQDNNSNGTQRSQLSSALSFQYGSISLQVAALISDIACCISNGERKF